MPRPQLAKMLIATVAVRDIRRLLSANAKWTDARLARELKEICYASWTAEPAAARRAARALEVLADVRPETEIKALASWVDGIAEITKGKLEAAVERLEEASRLFREIASEHESAQPLVAALIALGMLGRYGEARKLGRKALGIFEKYGDELAAGKIEMNLANIVSRLGRHREAETYCLSALRRFTKMAEPEWLAMAENGLANTYTELNEFAKAEKYLNAALHTASNAGMTLTVAEVESSLGNMALMRGHFDEALRFFELSRRKYERLKMPHQTAIAEMEIASIYAELNLTGEAAELYKRVAANFRRLSLGEEEARSRIGFAKAAARQGRISTARGQFEQAAKLLTEKGNKAGATLARLERAAFELRSGRLETAAELVRIEQTALRRLENPRFKLAGQLIEAEAMAHRAPLDADRRLLKIVDAAEGLESFELELAAMNAIGRNAMRRGDLDVAERNFGAAAAKIENSRGRLPADEFRISYLAANLEPYEGLVEVLLKKGDVKGAFAANERFRARSLAENSPTDDGKIEESKLAAESAAVREELNWQYRRATSNAADSAIRRASVLEKRLGELERKFASTHATSTGVRGEAIETASIRKKLGAESSLVEYFEMNGRFSAFLVDADGVDVIYLAATPVAVQNSLEKLHFHFGSLRYGGEAMSVFAGQIKARTDACLGQLYKSLIEPVRARSLGKNLIVVPSGVLHYVPFQALFDGAEYLLEKHIISYAPSAVVWLKLQNRKRKPVRRALLMAYADASIPLVDAEVESIRPLFEQAEILTGEAATFSAFRTNLKGHDLIHLACHGTFRPDNPNFSSLHLADGRVTVGDVIKNRIEAELVTLSACETGLSKVYAGNEILGLVRGFLAAGARSLVASLWNINDKTTTELMKEFYSHLQRGDAVAASLRQAQLSLIERGENPYNWAPFFAIE